MNEIILLGRFTKEPDIRIAESGTKLCRYTLAVRRTSQITDFFNCTAFNKSAEFLERYFHKGDMILVRGRLQNNSYEKDGTTFHSNQIITDEHYFTGGKSQGNSGFSPVDEFDDNIPF